MWIWSDCGYQQKMPTHTNREMSRGEMIRRLDEAAAMAAEALANGPLTPEEQRAVTASLAKLLPLVADSLQAQEDKHAATELLRRRPRRH